MKSALLALTTALAVAAEAQGPRLDPTRPEDALKAMRKLQASLVDGKPAVFWFQGSVFSRMPGERDRQLFTYQAMNIRTTYPVTDPARGAGHRLVSREILLYMDPQTKQVLRTWKNPWTGKDVEVVHIANDPVNQPPSFAQGPRGPARFDATLRDGWGVLTAEVPLFYPNPLGGEYQEYVGGTYHAIELFNFFFREDEVLGPGPEAPSVSVAWARVCQWLPWMEMGDRPGWLIFNGAGKKIAGYEALPEVLRQEIEAGYPAYQTPPPADDARPNETSWTYFKTKIDEKRKAAAPPR
jgi:hypothetical protein